VTNRIALLSQLDRQWHNTSSISDEKEALFTEKMGISDTVVLLPVKVWYELSSEMEYQDPREFVEEASYFRGLAPAGAEVGWNPASNSEGEGRTLEGEDTGGDDASEPRG
jgi:hypothetical protein